LRSRGHGGKPCGRAPAERLARGIPDHAGLAPQLAIPADLPCDFASQNRSERDTLKLRSIGLSDYSVLEGRQRIGRIRFAEERRPGVWLWNITFRNINSLAGAV
jgi:hypothetical protein